MLRYLDAILKNYRQTCDVIRMPERTGEDDRRRSQRFTCGGHAQVIRLPSNGIFLAGKVLDLSLGGCCVDITQPIDCGERAELVVRVNAASFRAVGEVRAVRGHSGACIEFVHLSSTGKEMLSDLVTDLARLQALMNKLKSDRREVDAESFRKQMEDGKLQAALLMSTGTLGERYPFLATILPRETPEPDPVESGGEDRMLEGRPLVIPVDLFG